MNYELFDFEDKRLTRLLLTITNTYYLLLITHYSLLITHYLLLITPYSLLRSNMITV